MNNRVIAKLCAMLIVICIALTTVATAFAVDDGSSDTVDSSSSEMISEVSSGDAPTYSAPSDPTAESSTDSQPSATESSTVSQAVTSSILSSEVSSEMDSQIESAPSETVSESVESADKNSNKEETASKETSSKKGTSSSKASSKKMSSKKDSTSNENKEEKPVSSYTTNAVSQYTPSYNEGSLSDEWEQEDDVELVSSKEDKDLSEHIFDPKKAVAKWIWLPILIALACIGVLIYVNVYVYNKGAHSPGAWKGNEEIDPDEDILEEADSRTEKEEDSDPFSAENFFNFDNDN